MFPEPSANYSTFRILLNYVVRFWVIVLAKLLIFRIKKVKVVVFESPKEPDLCTPVIDLLVDDLKTEISYSSTEKFVVVGLVQSLRLKFMGESQLPKDQMLVYNNNIKFTFKVPGKHDLTNAIFNSSLKATVEELNGNFRDDCLARFILFCLKGNLLKSLRRCVSFQSSPEEHNAKFESEWLGNDAIKVVG